jgi:hypothetical protein
MCHCINHTTNVVVTRASRCGVNVNMDVSCLHRVIMLSGTANHYTNIPVICEYYIHHLAEGAGPDMETTRFIITTGGGGGSHFVIVFLQERYHTIFL